MQIIPHFFSSFSLFHSPKGDYNSTTCALRTLEHLEQPARALRTLELLEQPIRASYTRFPPLASRHVEEVLRVLIVLKVFSFFSF